VPATFRDAAGVEHAPAEAAARIVCLVPSITELLCDLGLASELVGRTGFCIHPREVVRGIRKVGGTKDVKLDVVRELRPTHVVVNVDENRRETAEELAAFVPHVVVTHPLGPDDNPPLYRLLGGIFGREAEAERLCVAYAEARSKAVEAAAGRPRVPVLYLIWRDPWMTVSRDTYISRTLALLGWDTVPAASADRYPEVDVEAVAPGVERVLLSSEPYRFRERHLAEVAALAPGAQVSLVDGEMTSWYGSRAIRGLRYLAGFTASG
jgi:ABC-type Fe3+-hydroxamate transport system substrate-binding protein